MTETERKNFQGEEGINEERDKILAGREKELVENLGYLFDAKLVLKKQKGSISFQDNVYNVISKQELLNYAEMYYLIKKRALNKIDLGSEVEKETKNILSENKKLDIYELGLGLMVRLTGQEESYKRRAKKRS